MKNELSPYFNNSCKNPLTQWVSVTNLHRSRWFTVIIFDGICLLVLFQQSLEWSKRLMRIAALVTKHFFHNSTICNLYILLLESQMTFLRGLFWFLGRYIKAVVLHAMKHFRIFLAVSLWSKETLGSVSMSDQGSLESTSCIPVHWINSWSLDLSHC